MRPRRTSLILIALLFSWSIASAQEPLAKIKAILVNGIDKDTPSNSEMEVFRNDRSITVTKLMPLFANDRLLLKSSTRVALLYLRNAVETDKEAYLDSGSDVTIQGDKSIFVRLGKALLSLGGFFDGNTVDALYAAFGTEYMIEVAEDGTSTLSVLSGYVNVRPRNPVSYVPPAPSATPSQVLEFEVPAGKKIEGKKQLKIRNNCEKKHKFKIEAPDEPKAIELSDNKVELKGGESKTIEVKFRADADEVSSDEPYLDYLTVRCRDCEQDPGCEGFLIPFAVLVNTPGSIIVKKLQELTSTEVPDRKSVKPASFQRVSSIVGWSNEVIVGSQPNYTARGLIPHFISADRRNQVFKEARMEAIWNQRPGSHEILGSIYSDWGVGAKAVEAYNKELRIDPSKRNSAGLLAGLGEAHRLKGELDQAQKHLTQALKINPNWSPALNGIGNVYLDRANIVFDQSKNQEAIKMLEVAKQNYTKASQSAEEIPQADSVVHANLGETYLTWGDVAKEENRFDDALGQYKQADKEFSSFSRVESQQNPYHLTGMGKVSDRMGEIAKASGRSSPTEHFARSEEILKKTVGAYPEFSPAHVALGNVYENRGKREAAMQSYRRAIETRPDDPSPYYSLGKLLERENPRKAAEYLYTYLQLEPKAFKQGKKANEVRPLVKEEIGTTGENKPEPPQWSTTPTTPPDPTNTVKVPDVKGKDREDAVKKIQEKDLVAESVEQQACEDYGEVISQEPPKDTKVPPRSTVKITVAAGGTIRVPDLTGRDHASAASMLSQSGLRVGAVKQEETDRYAKGTISNQKPGRNSVIGSGCPVDLYVAIPIPRIPVPRFIGMTEAQARSSLAQGFWGNFADFRLGNVRYVVSRRGHGTVIDQSPEAGAMVPKRSGTRIDLVVARLSDYTPPTDTDDIPESDDEVHDTDETRHDSTAVPEVRQKDTKAAIEILKRKGFGYTIVQHGDGNRVCEQKPHPGEQLTRGSRVQLWLCID